MASVFRSLFIMAALGACAGSERPQLLLQHEAERGEALCVAVSESKGLLAAGYSNDRLRLFSLETGELVSESKGHRRGVTCIAFRADGERIASAGPDRTVRVWSVDPLIEERVLTGAGEPLARVSWNGHRVVAVTIGAAIVAWDEGQEQPSFFKPGPVQRGVSNLDLSMNGQTLAWSADGGNLRTWHTQTGTKRAGMRIESGLLMGAVAVGLGGQLVATTEVGTDLIEVWNMEDGLISQVRGLGSPARSMVFMGTRGLLAASSLAGALHLIDVASGRTLIDLALPMGSVPRLATSTSGNLLATAGPGRRVFAWNVNAVKVPPGLKRGMPLDSVAPMQAQPVQFSEDGRLDLACLAIPDYDPPELRSPSEKFGIDRFPLNVQTLAGKEITAIGFPLAAALEGEEVKTFLLSRFPPGCCFGSIPVMDEWIEVQAPAGTSQLVPDYRVEVAGILEIGEQVGPAGFATSLYRMRASSVRVLDG